MCELGCELLAAFWSLLFLLAFVRFKRYCWMREQDDLDEEEGLEH